jgi:hypothetical protein
MTTYLQPLPKWWATADAATRRQAVWTDKPETIRLILQPHLVSLMRAGAGV